MAVKYVCDKCGKMFDQKDELSEIHLFPSKIHPLYIHSFAYGKEMFKEVSPIVHMLCEKCASDVFGHYFGKPVTQTGGEMNKKEERYVTLLRATHTLLLKQYESRYDLNILAETVNYDDAECDGNCLLNDIEYYFDEIGVELPERINP